MKRFLSLGLLLCMTIGLFAQITVQGHYRPDIKKDVKRLSVKADANFTFDDIKFWVGEGSNKAALVIQWNDGKPGEDAADALVWGYKWDGETTGYKMITDIAKFDPRFYILVNPDNSYGSTIGGIGFDYNGYGEVALLIKDHTENPQYPVNGAINIPATNFDEFFAADPTDHWQSGWMSNGFWGYYSRDNSTDEFKFSDVAVNRPLVDGSWDAWNFDASFVNKPLLDQFTAVEPYQAFGGYSKGFFIINEDWFGTADGSLNYVTEDYSTVKYNAFKNENSGATFGTTTSFGTIYGDNLYAVSKQAGMTGTPAGGRLVVANASSLQSVANINELNGTDGRSFIGVNENTGYIGTSSGVYTFDMNTNAVGNLIEGTDGQQIGSMIFANNRVFAVKQSTGLLVIDTETNTLQTTVEGTDFNTVVLSKDGNVWVGTETKLVKINPYSLEKEEIALPSGAAINASWGAWNAGSMCAGTQSNMLYWINDGMFSGGSKVIRYDIDSKAFNTEFFVFPGQDGQYKQMSYGAGMRIDPANDNLVITTTESGWGTHYENNWIHIVGNDGQLMKTITLDPYYWFPSMPVFNDKYSPVISSDLNEITVKKEEVKIALNETVTDADNIPASIAKSIIVSDALYFDAYIQNDTLTIKPLANGKATIDLICNSNGKIVSKTIQVTVEENGQSIGNEKFDDAVKVYPNPFAEYLIVNTVESGYAEIYTIAGIKVKDVTLHSGENRIETNDLASGVYFLKTKANTYKVIKK
ncbi:MAG: DUF5074 domain-containing protein [Dysgonomonas sp.]